MDANSKHFCKGIFVNASKLCLGRHYPKTPRLDVGLKVSFQNVSAGHSFEGAVFVSKTPPHGLGIAFEALF